MSRSSTYALVVIAACGETAAPNAEPTAPAKSVSSPMQPRERCHEPPLACRGFADTNPHDPALGANVGAAAADGLFCVGIVKGHAQRCPTNLDSRTQEHLCPEYARGPSFPGQQVMCGPCRSSRAEMLAFGIKALLDPSSLEELSGCARGERCDAWRQCQEADAGRLRANDWAADFLGWSLAPGRELLFESPTATGTPIACRPHDAATWSEAVTFFARLSGLTRHMRCASLDVSHEANTLALRLKRGCRLRDVEEGDQEWIAAAVALNNAGVYCLADLPGGKRTANICGTDDLSACSPTRYVMATIVARLRGDIEPDACDPVDINDLTCEP